MYITYEDKQHIKHYHPRPKNTVGTENRGPRAGATGNPRGRLIMWSPDEVPFPPIRCDDGDPCNGCVQNWGECRLSEEGIWALARGLHRPPSRPGGCLGANRRAGKTPSAGVSWDYMDGVHRLALRAVCCSVDDLPFWLRILGRKASNERSTAMPVWAARLPLPRSRSAKGGKGLGQSPSRPMDYDTTPPPRRGKPHDTDVVPRRRACWATDDLPSPLVRPCRLR